MKLFLVLLTFHTCNSLLVNNPKIPYVIMLDNGLSVGDKITVTGRTLPDALRFSINIRHSWKTEMGINLFNFNPRFDEPNVTFDTLDWPRLTKIGRKPSGIYFRKGNNFTVEIVCQDNLFNVSVDGDPFMESKYMLLLEDADMLEVRGVKNRDVQVFSISLNNPSKDTIFFSGIAKTGLNLSESDTSINNVQCGSTSPYFVEFCIFFVILSIVFFRVVLWNTGLQDFSQPKK